MSEVVSAVASKVKTAVISKFSNWWWGKSEETSQAPQRQPQQVEHTSSISMRYECLSVVYYLLDWATSLNLY